MIKKSKNKMIGTANFKRDTSLHAKANTPKAEDTAPLTTYFFPGLQKNIKARNLEEALKIASKS